MSSDLVAYYEVSPNPENSVCMVSGLDGGGVVLYNIDTVTGEDVFIASQIVYEAMAAVTGLTVKQLETAVDAKRELMAAKKDLKAAQAKLLKWESLGSKLEDLGLVVRDME